ncbi:diguanylate cyclase [Pseudoalteromonas xiamenensis]|uniref:sensor domain-containing diguanylate cyclase n=1 Tax=Pseudoalteromonas xiamenensis TaxID=882626 RepID=UPI0027E46CBB|nr:GGDEF domain-containing protein [Pseudoalteromonas xiamenensis]WMN60247.1 diguanylate cyclase [Pseudoalteromonas xiamenensis]
MVENERVIDSVTNIVACLNTSDSIQRFLLDIHCILQKITYADNFYVVLFKENGRLSFPYFHDVMDDIRAEELDDVPVEEIGKSLTAYALNCQRVCNYSEDEIKSLIGRGVLKVLGTIPKQWLCFPLINRQSFMGAFIIQSYRREDEYSGMIIDVLYAISHVISSALDAFNNQQALVQANASLNAYKTELESRVLERTQELEKSLTELRTEMTKSESLQAKLEFEALHDSLTGLTNRKYLFRELERLSSKSTRTDVKVFVIYIDLDDFKPINDNYGHHSGDEVLVAVANRLMASVREYDTVSRLGGDEFVILIDDGLTEVDLEILVTRILNAIKKPIHLSNGDSVACGASIGISSNAESVFNAETLLVKADVNLYEAKSKGKNQFVIA